MKEIKFKAWNKKEKKMYQMEVFSIHNPEVEFLQFTGLLDCNGKEVYEGDILQFQTFDAKGVVKYTAPHFHASGHELRGYEFEIIGNIYENTDLLKD